MDRYFIELSMDQARAAVDARQRFQALDAARERRARFRGSMTWSQSRGRDYLLRSDYGRTGVRKQSSLGPRSPTTEALKADFETGRVAADENLAAAREAMKRQAAMDRAVGIGRVPVLGARIVRAIEDAGLLGAGIRIVGTNALYAYEAAAGVHVDPGLTTTEDVDLLFDSRRKIAFAVDEAMGEVSLLALLRKVDRTFERTRRAHCAANAKGFMVDLIKPMRDPPWKRDRDRVADVPGDVVAAEIEGLVWHESAPPFEAIAIDDAGSPVRIVTSDPRVFAIHKDWLSRRIDRDPLKKTRDAAQARCVAALTVERLPHLPFDRSALRMLPLDAVEAASRLFRGPQTKPL